MAIPNSSYQSLGRPVNRAVDISDLRDALGSGGGYGHANGNTNANGNMSAAQSFVSSSPSAKVPSEKKVRPDAKEILKDIFKDKKRA
jgi:hypothetical protein